MSIYTATGEERPRRHGADRPDHQRHYLPGRTHLLHGRRAAVILRTTNGTRFTPVKTSTRANLNGITCVTTVACYVVGADGTIEASHEG